MADERLREFERRFRETGSIQDEVAWLRERVRAGDLSSLRLDLAAYCGHPAAQAASLAPVTPPEDVADWFKGLSRWGDALALHAYATAILSECTPDSSQLHQVAMAIQTSALSQSLSKVEFPSRYEGPDSNLARAQLKVLRVVSRLAARNRRYVDRADPEVTRALEAIESRFPALSAERWSYNHSDLGLDGHWQHHLYYERRNSSTPHQVRASDGWAPPPGSELCPEGRGSAIHQTMLPLADPDSGRAAAAKALIQLALQSSDRGSE